MQDIYIKNSGITKTLIHSNNNNKNEINEIKWDADYDGNVANISLDFNNNGMIHYDMKFDNFGYKLSDTIISTDYRKGDVPKIFDKY